MLEIALPEHLPAQCVVVAARDYQIPEILLLAVIKQESEGRPVARANRDGSIDYGVSQINSKYWGAYFAAKYRISPEMLMADNCLAIRAAGYVLRSEQAHAACRSKDLWCAVGRYNAPNNAAAAETYVWRVAAAMRSIQARGAF
jgi:soluble lytic murein transglycosylase-like protein